MLFAVNAGGGVSLYTQHRALKNKILERVEVISKILEMKPEGKRRLGRPRLGWLGESETYLR